MTTHDEILRLEQRLLDPLQRRDPDRLAELLDDEFVEYGGSGRVFDKAEALEAMRATPERTFELDGFRVRELAPGCVLATYRVASGGIRSLRSSIWRRRGSAWRVVFHQGTVSAR